MTAKKEIQKYHSAGRLYFYSFNSDTSLLMWWHNDKTETESALFRAFWDIVNVELETCSVNACHVICVLY